MKVVCCQLNTLWEARAANHLKVRELLRASPPPRGSMVILPEMFATGFSMNVAAVSDTRSRETSDFLAQLASEQDVYVVGGVVHTASDGRGRNECAVFSPDGREVTRYCKMYPFTYAGESKHYVSGEDIRLFPWQGFTVAPFICYDLRFPEVFRAAVTRGAEVFVVIANWPTPRIQHWVALLKARAIENQAYVVGVNRCGSDPQLHYPGRSMVIDPQGAVVVDAGAEEGIVNAELDLEALRSYRREFPVLADIRSNYMGANVR